jgi:hypothetical protein
MALSSLQKKIGYWLGGIILTLVVLIGGVAIYLNAKWKPIATEKIKDGVYKGSKHLYRIDFKDIHINLVTGNVVLDSITLTPDTTIFNQLKLQKKAPVHIFRLKLAHLKLSRVAVLNAYFNKKVRLNAIVLDRPTIDMIYNKVPRQKVEKNDSTLYQQIAKTLREIRIGSIRIIDADFDYYKGNKKMQSVKHLTFNAKDFLVDSLSQHDSTRVLYSKDLNFELAGYQSQTKDKMYTLKVDTLLGSLTKKTLAIKGVKLIPVYPEIAFSKKYTTQKDRYNLNFQAINFIGVDFLGLNDDGDLRAKKVVVGPAKVAIFMNRELPPPAFDKVRNYPHNALKRLPIPTVVDTLGFNKIDIAYTEYSPKTKEKGTVRLENLTGNILNVTNDSLQLSKKNHAYADLTTYVMGAGKMNVKIDFNLTDKNLAFSYVGNIGAFDMKVLNPLSKPLGQIQIETGNVKSAYFNISANARSSKGIVQFSYSDLKVNLLDKEENGANKKKGLLSFLANKLLIKDANPSKGDKMRVANVTYTRVPQASFFNLMWKSVFVGIRENVGIGAIPMKSMPKPKSKKK